MSTSPAFDVSSLPAAPKHPRHALGLPAGSVRAILAFMVLAVLWLLALFANRAAGETYALTGDVPVAYVYLQYVMILILAHFFAAHGSTIGRHISHKSPLGLPSGSVRFLLLAGYIGLVVWLFTNHRQFEEPPKGPFALPLVLLSAFFVGFLVTRLVKAGSRGGQIPFWFQDVQAWFALLAVIGLVIITLIYLFIFPSIEERLQWSMTGIETVVAGIVGFYFGARS